MESMRSTAQGAVNGTFDVDGHTQHVGCPPEEGKEDGYQDSSANTGGSSDVDGSRLLEPLPQPFSLLAEEPLPCDAQIVSLNVHRPMGALPVRCCYHDTPCSR